MTDTEPLDLDALKVARIEVKRGDLTEFPLAEQVKGGWQSGATFYPNETVTKVLGYYAYAGPSPVRTDADLIAVEARVNFATPGPWVVGGQNPNAPGGVYMGTATDPDDAREPGILLGSVGENDAEFIAAARTDVPALIAEVRRLRELQEDTAAENARLSAWWHAMRRGGLA